MPKKIIFRADGNSTTGLGHLYRLFSLVEVVKNTFTFEFLTHHNSTDAVIPNAYTKKIIPKDINIVDEPDWLSKNYPSDEYIIIVDGYQFTASYQKELKQKGYSLIYIDDLAKEHMYADVVINHSPYIEDKHYNRESYTKLALGTQYALLRPLFLEEAKKSKTIIKLDTVFVCFGGSDPYNLSLKAVKALLQMPVFKYVYVVLGGAYKDHGIYDLEAEFSNRIKIYKNLSEGALIEVMKKCNFAIAPASTILYELSCIKMPIFSGFYVDNQELIYKGFLNNNAIYKGGNMKNYTVFDFVKHIEVILKEQKFRHQINVQKALFDDEIALRHLNLIKELC